jgi:DNA repair protein RadA/Sms
VLEAAGVRLGRRDLYGATAGGARVDDPACDLAVAAALASAVAGVPVPSGTAFVGEVGLTGMVRPSASFGARGSAARAAGIATVFAAPPAEPPEGVHLARVSDMMEALTWAAVGRTVVRARA